MGRFLSLLKRKKLNNILIWEFKFRSQSANTSVNIQGGVQGLGPGQQANRVKKFTDLSLRQITYSFHYYVSQAFMFTKYLKTAEQ